MSTCRALACALGTIALGLPLGLRLPGTRAAEPAAPRLDRQVAELVAQHCVRCHGEKKAEAKLRLDQLDGDFTKPATFDRWQMVAARLRAGEMPPEGEPRPDAAKVATVLRRLTAGLDEAASARRAAGRVVLRRLNRVEYENTIRDLLGIEVDLKESLPQDTSSHGFDNVGEALHTSSFLMEKYLEAAEKALDLAIANTPQPPKNSKRFSLKDQHHVKTPPSASSARWTIRWSFSARRPGTRSRCTSSIRLTGANIAFASLARRSRVVASR
jgi:mono/diheme cytochrome c family protein